MVMILTRSGSFSTNSAICRMAGAMYGSLLEISWRRLPPSDVAMVIVSTIAPR